MNEFDNMIGVNYKGLEKHYLINEYGSVYSMRRSRILKGMLNGCGYIYYTLVNELGSKKMFSAARLVAYTYLPAPLDPKMEINHKDHNRTNNHYTNLEWITHKENIKHSYLDGNRAEETDRRRKARTGYKASNETKLLQAQAKYKPVILTGIDDMIDNNFASIQHAADWLHVERSTLAKHIYNQRNIKSNYKQQYYQCSFAP